MLITESLAIPPGPVLIRASPASAYIQDTSVSGAPALATVVTASRSGPKRYWESRKPKHADTAIALPPKAKAYHRLRNKNIPIAQQQYSGKHVKY